MDDPILIAAGSREQRLRCFTVVLLFWASQGFDLGWKKDQKGSRVKCVGGECNLLRDGVAVKLKETKTQAAQDNVDELLHGLAMPLVKK